MPSDEPIVAFAGKTDVHKPPGVPSLSVVLPPGQTVDVPVMGPVDGSGFTVITAVAA